MKGKISIALLGPLLFSAGLMGQDIPKPIADAPMPKVELAYSSSSDDDQGAPSADPQSPITGPGSAQKFQASAPPSGVGEKFHYYLTETYFNGSALTAPAFRAGIRMANPPGKGATAYPSDWRQGAEAFGRNYGDAVAQRLSFHTARFLTGVITREDPHYSPSSSHNFFARSVHAVGFTFVDHSDTGHAMPAISNFVGAAASGFVGNAYLPAGFNDVTHAGQRATIQFGVAAAGNLFREFAPQMPRPVRTFFMLIAR